MHRAPHGADDIVRGVPDSRASFSRHMFRASYSYNTAACVWRVARTEHNTRPSLAPDFRYDLFQFLCRFPNLLTSVQTVESGRAVMTVN